LNYLRRRHPEAEAAYQAVRTINDPQQLEWHLQQWCGASHEASHARHQAIADVPA
jgi:tRNA-dihydrouridine synthase C